MNEKEMLKKVITQTIKPRTETKRIIEAYINCIWEALMNGECVKVRNLGTFRPATVKAHKARNPRTGEEIMVPEKKTITFKLSTNLKRVINKGE